jgi:CheY-like chemotaxis protein
MLRLVGFSRMSAAWSCARLENTTRGDGMVAQGMVPVLVVEYDNAVRDMLHELLTDAGFEVNEHATDAAALDFLAESPDGVVVLYSNQDADHHLSAAFFAQVVADERFTSRHQYLLLSSNPPLIPPALETHLAQLNAAVLPKPFDIDILVARVRQAAARLAPSDTGTSATG